MRMLLDGVPLYSKAMYHIGPQLLSQASWTEALMKGHPAQAIASFIGRLCMSSWALKLFISALLWIIHLRARMKGSKAWPDA